MGSGASDSPNSLAERLLAFPFEEGNLLILTHDNPDPDCLASSAALKYLLSKMRGIEATLGYSGIIGRAENRTMVHLLEIPAHHVIELDFADYRYIALVDAQPLTGNTAIPDDRSVDLVIDHHPMRNATRSVPFSDVNPGIGATATILTEYLRTAGLEIPVNLATGLLYGIRSETQDLGREVSDRDRRAYEYLLPLADTAKLAAISRPVLERRYYAQLRDALDALHVGDTTAVSVMGEVSDPDFVPEIADLAARMEGVEWTLALGSHCGRLYVSIRTGIEDAHAETLMHRMLDGIGRGGGHGMRAGGAVELAGHSLDRFSIEQEIVRRFLEGAGEKGRLERVD